MVAQCPQSVSKLSNRPQPRTSPLPTSVPPTRSRSLMSFPTFSWLHSKTNQEVPGGCGSNASTALARVPTNTSKASGRPGPATSNPAQSPCHTSPCHHVNNKRNIDETAARQLVSYIKGQNGAGRGTRVRKKGEEKTATARGWVGDPTHAIPLPQGAGGRWPHSAPQDRHHEHENSGMRMFVSHANRLKPHRGCRETRVDLTMFSLGKVQLAEKNGKRCVASPPPPPPPVGIRRTHHIVVY